MPDGIHLDEHGRRIYEPDGAVLAAYLEDERPVVVVRGPIGSGTSSASCYKLMYLATQSPKWTDGVRRSRWFVIRNTYAELKGSTLETWRYWFPEERYGRIVLSRPMVHEVRFADVCADFVFIALDGDDDISKLRSWEFNGGWINELEFIGKPIFDEAQSRCRYPPVVDIGGVDTWRGVIADTNAPGEEHWLVRMTGEVPYPDETRDEDRMRWDHDAWGYHVQPPGVLENRGPDGSLTGYRVNPKAENLRFLRKGYYEDTLRGKSKDWIDSRLRNEIVTVIDGDPVWPRFSREDHVVMAPLPLNPAHRLIIVLDFGRRPTALLVQEIGSRVLVLREFRMYGVGMSTFAPELKRFLTQNFPGATLEATGDPKGRDRGQNDETSAYDIFERVFAPLKIVPAPVKQNAIETRIEIVAYALDVRRRVLISGTGCPTLVAGMSGKYHLKKLDTGEAQPVKDKYSDPCDCLGYVLAYLGDGRQMIGLKPVRDVKPMRIAAPQRSLRRVS